MSPAPGLHGLLETALNGWLRRDPEAMSALGELDGRVIALELVGVGSTLFLHPGSGGIRVSGEPDHEPDTVLSGTPLGLAGLTLGERADQAFFSGNVSIRGDTELGQRFKRILDSVEVDWEEILSGLVGDPLAHQAGRLARHLRGTVKRTGDTLRQNLSEYLREEARLLPTRIEVDNFLDEIDRVREDCDRLEARIRRLAHPHDGNGPPA